MYIARYMSHVWVPPSGGYLLCHLFLERKADLYGACREKHGKCGFMVEITRNVFFLFSLYKDNEIHAKLIAV